MKRIEQSPGYASPTPCINGYLHCIVLRRARAIGDHVDLPQLVVCGDQSAGKSSVLEGITGLPFPRQDGVCTKFATEIILQHSDGERVIFATVLPTASRPEQSKLRLQGYRRQLAEFDELPIAIAEVGSMMGIRGFEDVQEGPAFTSDVLRIEVTGPVGLHLTVVDLPGLISVANDEQTEDDVRTVQDLVDSYVANPRTIILAVVQANNDIANQGIIQKSRRFDQVGERTVGIITKPDLINEGTQKRIALLAKNEDTTKLKLGFFLVKNPTPSELKNGITSDQRRRAENRCFQSSPWKEQALMMERVGVMSLQKFLQNLLDQHIERELPKVREEIRDLMEKTEQEITALGDDRPTVGHLRMFLSRLAMQFHNITTSALHGNYHETDPTFFHTCGVDNHSTRLRALTHRLNSDFSSYMRDNGQKRKVVSDELDEDSEPIETEEGQLLVTESEMREWVKEIYINSRGRELPGKLLRTNYRLPGFQSVTEILGSLWGLCSALDAVHNYFFSQFNIQQIGCYYDIKPKNILFSNGKLLLADFGLSRLRKTEEGSQTTFKRGEGDYIAPECEAITDGFKRGRIGRANDVWSLGCVLAEILAYLSVEPAEGPTAVQKFTEERRLKVGPYIFHNFFGDKEINPGVQRFFERCKQNLSSELKLLARIVDKILQFDPDQRPSAADVTRSLFHLTQQTRVSAITSTLGKDVEPLDFELDIEIERLRIWSEMVGLNADPLDVPRSTWFAVNHSFDEYTNLELLIINIQTEIGLIATELQKTSFGQPAFPQE